MIQQHWYNILVVSLTVSFLFKASCNKFGDAFKLVTIVKKLVHLLRLRS